MESVGSSLPELEPPGGQDVSAPMRGTWDLGSRIASLDLLPFLLQFSAVAQDRALVGGPGADLGSTRSAPKVSFRLRHRYLGDPASDADLALLVRPIKHQRCFGVFLELKAFAAI